MLFCCFRRLTAPQKCPVALTSQARRSKNESGGAEPYIPYIPLMIEKKSLFSKKVEGLKPLSPLPHLRRACQPFIRSDDYCACR